MAAVEDAEADEVDIDWCVKKSGKASFSDFKVAVVDQFEELGVCVDGW